MDADCVEVIEVGQDNRSLTAKTNISKGTFLGDKWGRVMTVRGSHSHQVGVGKHVDNVGQTRFINHSCSPNAEPEYHAIRNVDSSHQLQEGYHVSWPIVATRDIYQGEAITTDYTLTEYTMAAPFDCACKSPNCLGRVQGFMFLHEEEKKKRLPKISPAVREEYEKDKPDL